MSKIKVEPGSSPADPKYHITVALNGPYLVFGNPPLAQQFIMLNRQGECWYFEQGRSFQTLSQPTALCRCGASRNKPYCDGAHLKARWDPELTSPEDALLDNVEIIRGEGVSMTDNEKYCVFARFCHPAGSAWRLTEESGDEQARELAVREASMCPSGRLMAWDNRTRQPYEYRFEPSLGLIEDPAIGASGGLWVRGGIRMERSDGRSYEIRNRVVLCRCGVSRNKPYCDGTHAAVKWRDELEGEPRGETLPQEVY